MQTTAFLQPFSDETTSQYGLACTMLRLDLLHPVVSGNKLFKLNFYLKEAIASAKKGIVTLGGPHSNHLVATAFAAKKAGLHAIGLVRGEKPEQPSVTLEDCSRYGMELIYLSRKEFGEIQQEELSFAYPSYMVVPQGGYGVQGMMGAKAILDLEGIDDVDCIVAACGTGTMGAGLVAAASAKQKILLVSVLKNNFSIRNEIDALLHHNHQENFRYDVDFGHHLGGYAKHSETLFATMNWFYQTHGIPTDFVYTGKMVHAFYQMIQMGRFAKKSKILLIHSGGLQGNRSLTKNELIY